MEQSNRIFMIDNIYQTDKHWRHILENHGYEVFETNNAYQLIRYADELKPHLYIMDNNAEDVDIKQILQYLGKYHYLEYAPAVVLNNEHKQLVTNSAAHYISSKESESRLLEIADVYCRGGTNYYMLMLENYSPFSKEAFKETNEFNVSYFQVYNPSSAKIFLQHNFPQVLMIHCLFNDYDKIRKQIGFKNTFFVENHDNVENLISFLN